MYSGGVHLAMQDSFEGQPTGTESFADSEDVSPEGSRVLQLQCGLGQTLSGTRRSQLCVQLES